MTDTVSDTPTIKPLVVPDVQTNEARREVEETLKPAWIDFRGKIMEVRYPSPEQYSAIMMVKEMLADPTMRENLTKDQALELMRDAFGAATSLLTNQNDVSHIRSMWLSGKLNLEQTIPILQTALDALNIVNGNRETKRAARKSAPKAGVASLETT